MRFGHLVIGLSDEGCHKSSMLHEVFTVGLESGRTESGRKSAHELIGRRDAAGLDRSPGAPLIRRG